MAGEWGLIENAAAVPVLHQWQGADGAARATGQGQGKLPLQRQPFFQHAGHATGCQRRRQLIQIVHLPLPLAVVPLAGRLENGGEEFAGLCGDGRFRQQCQRGGDRDASSAQKGFLLAAILTDAHRAGGRTHRLLFFEQGQGGGGHILELTADGLAAAGQIVQGGLVIIGSDNMVIGGSTGDAGRVGIQHHHLVAEAVGGPHEVAAKLASPQHAEGGGWQDHVGSSSCSACTRSRSRVRKSSSCRR